MRDRRQFATTALRHQHDTRRHSCELALKTVILGFGLPHKQTL